MRRKNEKVVIEDVELKPQVIGQIYEKKTNIGRVLVIFVVFGLVVYFINDITLYLNNLFGKRSVDSIKELTEESKKKKEEEKEIKAGYYEVDNASVISVDNLSVTHFKYDNKLFAFDVYNYTDDDIDLSSKKYFLNTYDSSKELLNSYIIDFKSIKSKNKDSFSISIPKEFVYFKIEEKSIDSYPNYTITYNDNVGNLVCTLNSNIITYTFSNEGLIKISDVFEDIKDNNNYYLRYNAATNKMSEYNNLDGVDASFNTTANGYKTIVSIDLQNANINSFDNNNYYQYKEELKVVNYEVTSRGYTCK